MLHSYLLMNFLTIVTCSIMKQWLVKDRLQISLLILSEFKRINQLLFLTETIYFLMILGGIEVN